MDHRNRMDLVFRLQHRVSITPSSGKTCAGSGYVKLPGWCLESGEEVLCRTYRLRASKAREHYGLLESMLCAYSVKSMAYQSRSEQAE